jgi:hypothetical protein
MSAQALAFLEPTVDGEVASSSGILLHTWWASILPFV